MIKVEGYKEATAILRQLPDHVQNTLVKQTLRKAASPVVREAKNRVPKQTGLLKSKIKISNWKAVKPGRVSVAIRPVFDIYKSGKINAYYGLWVHDGTKDRRPRKKKVLVFKVGSRLIFSRKTKGIRPNPYLEEAYKAKGYTIPENFGKELGKKIENWCNKRYKKII